MHYSVAIGREGGNFATLYKQLVVAGLGYLGFFVLSAIDFRTWESLAKWLYGAMAGLLVIVLVFGTTINATRGWLVIGGFQFQPVELAKFVAIIVLATYFARRARVLNRLPYLVQSFLIILGLVGLVLLQPDFGSAALLLFLWGALVFAIGIRREFLIVGTMVVVVGFAAGWLYLFKPYQKDRLRTFLFPSEQTAAQSYNVRQAMIAIGSGQLFGRGLAQGSQSQLRFLPEAGTDFIFAVVGEELGFAGIVALITLLALLYYRLFALLARSQDGFACFVVLGTILLLTIEIFINAGMTMGLFPVVGIPFPFLSAGGSSLLAHLALFGVVMNIARMENSRGYHISSGGIA